MNITVTKNPNPGKLPPADQLGFGSVFTVACGFFGSITACWRAGRVVAGRSAVCVFAVSRDALPLRTGATVAGSVGNVELTATLFNCC